MNAHCDRFDPHSIDLQITPLVPPNRYNPPRQNVLTSQTKVLVMRAMKIISPFIFFFFSSRTFIHINKAPIHRYLYILYMYTYVHI